VLDRGRLLVAEPATGAHLVTAAPGQPRCGVRFRIASAGTALGLPAAELLDLTVALPGGYDVYGPRVPAVVVSPYSRPNAVSDVVYDHTSLLATIEAKWNLPALTYRDANAATVLECLNLDHPALLTAPVIEGPSQTGPSGPVSALK
jgi:hypothetical protein